MDDAQSPCKKIKRGFILPSAAFTLKTSRIKYYRELKKKPELGDVIYGRIVQVGQHSSLENRSGRIHTIHNGTTAICVFSNRYAPDYYEAFVPEEYLPEVDLIARSGVVGTVRTKNSLIKDPTRVQILGYVCTGEGEVLNTLKHPLVVPRRQEKQFPRSRMILVCGTTMNSGKSVAAAACCWGLSSLGHSVRGSKITGTASLKDILNMNDAGAHSFSDFTFLGYPATYMLSREQVLGIFNDLDLKFANNPNNYWVIELADGINQRETAMLLESEEVQRRIHRLIFCANDAFSALGGLDYLKQRFGLTPHLLSGICTSSPLHVRELTEVVDIPVLNSMNVDIGVVKKHLLA